MQEGNIDSALKPAGGRKLPARFTPVAFAFYMSAIMAFLMSLIIVAANSGVSEGYLGNVLHAYRIAMPSAFGCILLVRPLVMRLVKLTVNS
jgi:hypothetical protein